MTIRVKEFYPTFGLRFNWYSDDEERAGNLINICLIWGNLWLQVPRILKARVKRESAKSWDAATIARMGRDWYETKIERVYGLTFTRSNLHVHYGIQPGCWSRRDKKNSDHTKLFTYPWANWRMVRHEVMMHDGSWIEKPHDWCSAIPSTDRDGLYRERLPYHYKDKHVDQITTATITAERREWRLKLLPWLPLGRNQQSISIDFSDEIGAERGSWKGGVLGCSELMMPGETPEQTLRRVEGERKF